MLTSTIALQLPPFTTWKRAEEFKYDISLLQRLVERKGVHENHNLMTVQYRMHPKQAEIVSSVFYNGRLTTAREVAAQRERSAPVVFMDASGREEKHGTSFKNYEGGERSCEACREGVAGEARLRPST